MELNEEVTRALRFIKDFHINQSEWRENGKPARSAPDKWNQFRMSGPEGSITISKEAQDLVRQFTQVGPKAAHGGIMYVLNAAGIRRLATA